MTSPAETVNRYRKARRTADAIIAAHTDMGATVPVTVVAEHMDEAAWQEAAGGPSSAATRALVRELLSEHERAVVGSEVAS